MADLVERRIRKERLQRKQLTLYGLLISHAMLVTILLHTLPSGPKPMIDIYPEDCSFTVYQVPLKDYFSQKALRVAFSPTMNGTKEVKFFDTEQSRWSVVKPYEQELYREVITAFLHRKVRLYRVDSQYIWSESWNPISLCKKYSQAQTRLYDFEILGSYDEIIIHEEVEHDNESTFQVGVRKVVDKTWGHIKAFVDFYGAHTNNLLKEIKAKLIA